MYSLENRIKQIKKEFKEISELKVREIFAFNKKFALIYLDSFSDFNIISSNIIKPILESNKTYNEGLIILNDSTNKNDNKFIKFITDEVLYASEISLSNNMQDFIEKILRGEKLLLIDEIKQGIIINNKKLEKRSIIEPPNNNVVRGPREGFIEDILSNINLIRRRLTTQELKIENLEIGRYTKTKVALLYLNKIADKKIVKKILNKLKKIDIDGIIDSYYLEDFLEEHPTSIFKQVGFTEKPDIATAKMLEGRVVILVDGSPIALTLPFVLMEDLQSSSDYYEENTSVSFFRIIRFLGLFIAITMPGLYIALQLYHYKALPLKFLITIINSSQNIPMPPAIEVLFVIFMFEVLYEASIRTPKSLGSSFNIIGALILGDTAVKSNLSSAPTIMIIALSSIAIYLIPEGTNVLRLLRFMLVLMATAAGIVGICIGLLFIFVYLSDFDSYNAAYLSPIAPYNKKDYKDALIKGNIINMKTRPAAIRQKNKIRQGGQNGKEQN